MKTKITILMLLLVSMFGCDSDEGNSGETALFAVPVVRSLSDIRQGVSIMSARQTNSDGKIYVDDTHLYYIAQESGVHVFDNSNPASPVNSVFIEIPGVHDIAIKGDFLYADNFVDLLVFDISDIGNIQLINTVENTIQFYPTYPENADFYDYTSGATEGEIVTGFTLEQRERPEGSDYEVLIDATADFESSNGANAVGTGGSYAKFQINKDALYTIDAYQLNVFNIASPENTYYDKAVYMNQWFGGGEFETLFKQKEFLFVGSTNGMFVVNAQDEFNPVFISGFSHATACDPVVVFENTAYITVRGGTTCGAIEDQINVIDITDITNPTLTSTFLLSQPYGLGIWDGRLYVCSQSGLNVFDASNPAALDLRNTYAENVKDVIALPSHLIAVGENRILQFNYGADFTLVPLSEVNF